MARPRRKYTPVVLDRLRRRSDELIEEIDELLFKTEILSGPPPAGWFVRLSEINEELRDAWPIIAPPLDNNCAPAEFRAKSQTPYRRKVRAVTAELERLDTLVFELETQRWPPPASVWQDLRAQLENVQRQLTLRWEIFRGHREPADSKGTLYTLMPLLFPDSLAGK